MKKITLSLIVFIQALVIQSQNLVFSAQDDLNSDNIIDKISLKENDDMTYTLKINNYEISKEFEVEGMDGFKIVDINNNDVYREIAVHASGPSDDDVWHLYFFNGKKIIFMNSLQNWLTYNGNGIVYVDNWEGFWKRRRKFLLNKNTHKLTSVPQFAYYVGIKNITVNSYVSIFCDKELSRKTAVLNRNTKIEILLCEKNKTDYNNDLYLVKSKSGLLGWIKYKNLIKNCSGFNFAD